jgi:predicted  nucleic acid-binding Zn-ribbon protein
MAANDPHFLELKEAVARHTERIQYLETQLSALEKASSWWRQFTSTALPIMVTIIVSVWAIIVTQGGRLDELSRRIDDTNKRIDNLDQRVTAELRDLRAEMKDLRQDVKQVLKQTGGK